MRFQGEKRKLRRGGKCTKSRKFSPPSRTFCFERSRFENELRRSRHLDAFAIIVEASLPDVLRMRGGLSVPAILGTIAAWSRRFCPVIFAGSVELAADVALRYLHQPTEEARRYVAKANREHKVIDLADAPAA